MYVKLTSNATSKDFPLIHYQFHRGKMWDNNHMYRISPELWTEAEAVDEYI